MAAKCPKTFKFLQSVCKALKFFGKVCKENMGIYILVKEMGVQKIQNVLT